MPRLPALPLVLLLSACTGSPDSQPLQGGDTCTVLTSGAWTFSGTAFGMGDSTMDGDVTLNATACTFTLDNWTMSMDDLPSGGAIDGDMVTLDGLNSRWRTCTGTATDENTVTGTCSDDGSDWTMVSGST